ncbi:MAG: hypothetical protein LBQ41_04215 [Candidatus Ancillula sp.]|jgi:hypothetical protein|nr:hypothetical protein [Candidatus Ancillula sp.]
MTQTEPITRTLKVYDFDLLEYTPSKNNEGNFVCHIEKVYDENKWRLPLDLELTDVGLEKWIRKRTIPKNRAYVDNFLSKVGLNLKHTQSVIDICFGMSLNDSFWIAPEGFSEPFSNCNLYENKFTDFISEIAFNGIGSFSHPGTTTSPEFTTGGMLPKAWRKIDGDTYLYKGGTSGFANAGNEPYSEYYASQIARALGYNSTEYDLELWKEQICSVCKLWTNIDLSYISIGRLVKHGGMEGVLEFYKQLDEENELVGTDMSFEKSLSNLLILDAIIINEDRHFGNFGVLIDSHKNKIIKPAPIFDNGLSLLWSGMSDDLENWREFMSERLPKAYDDFVVTAKKFSTADDIKNVEKLIDFKFVRHPEHNLPEERLVCLEELVQHQVRELLKV